MAERVGKCTECGGNAAWNTPALTLGGKLVCDNCADKLDEFTHGVEQFLDADGKYVPDNNGTIRKGGVVLWMKHNGEFVPPDEVSCWTDGGSKAWPLNDEEKKMLNRPFELIDSIIEKRKNGYRKCTECGKLLKEDEVAGYPLFAGVACKECWKKHLEHLKDQREKGHVCLLCGQPYDNCCC